MELAPQRVYTHQRLAEQEILKGNYREAIRIVESFEAAAPNAAQYFKGLKRVAQQALEAQEGGG